MYICTITSNSSHPQTFEVKTKSAMKCALEFGKCEGGEVVSVKNKSGKLISEVRWTPEEGGKYFKTWEHGKFHMP